MVNLRFQKLFAPLVVQLKKISLWNHGSPQPASLVGICIAGILFILLGAYVFASPASAYLALSFLFGLIILLAGVSKLLHAHQDKGSANRGWHLLLI